MKKVLLIISLIFSLYVLATPVLAAPVIDFGTGFAGAGGILTHVGTNVSGSGIGLDVLIVSGTNSMDGVYDLSGGFSGTTPGSTSSAAVLNFDTGIGSNFIQVIGGVPSLSIPDDTVLLNGIIYGSEVYDNGTVLAISQLTGSDTKDPDLLAALGIPATSFTFLGFNISAKDLQGNYVAHSTDIFNTPVPIPSAILLLGGGLAGLAVFRRRWRV